MRQVGEQYWRSLLPALSRNHLPHPGAGHLAHRMMPVGRMSFIAYPGASHTYQYDDMGRLSTMDNGDTARATYGAAGEMLTLWMNGAGTETRTYNSLLQMTRQRTVGDDYLHTVLLDMEYRYPTAQNNGRIAQSKDWVNGEEVTYTYDALQRLAKAETTGWNGARRTPTTASAT